MSTTYIYIAYKTLKILLLFFPFFQRLKIYVKKKKKIKCKLSIRTFYFETYTHKNEANFVGNFVIKKHLKIFTLKINFSIQHMSAIIYII